MRTEYDTYCGLSCKDCELKEKMNCSGCIETKGNPFHGKCEVAECAKAKKRGFCGECGEFPCDTLKKYSFDPEHGDNGERIENCKHIKLALVAEARKGQNPQAVCGFSCNHCFMGQWCGGCRSSYNCCSYGTLFEGNVCPNVACANEKKLEGCYQCDELYGCAKGFYSIKDQHVAKAAALCIKEFGQECTEKALLNVIKQAEKTGKTLEKAKSVDKAYEMLKSCML